MPDPMPPEELDHHMRILRESHDRDALLGAATTLVASEDSSALFALLTPLSDREFLSRLDDTADPSVDMDNLMVVFRELAQHHIPQTERVCEILYREPDFGENPARLNLLLVALAAVRPTSPEAAAVFKTTSLEGYASVNGPLLVQNESPLALQVFEELIAEDGLDVDTKIDLLHRSVLPRRTSLPVVEMCARLLDRALPAEVTDAIVETLFHHHSKRWFGPVMSPPLPPPWDLATTPALELLIALAGRYPSAAETRTELEHLRQTRESAE